MCITFLKQIFILSQLAYYVILQELKISYKKGYILSNEYIDGQGINRDLNQSYGILINEYLLLRSNLQVSY